MTKEQKRERRIERSKYRRKKRMTKYVDKIQQVSHLPSYVPLNTGQWGSWVDPNSPTGYSQVCDYYVTCQSPCNGDC